jgi:hypothetical protein
MRYEVGRVQYDVPETFSFPTEAIAGIAAGGGFLLVIIIIILIIYRRQSTRAERIYHKLQIQLDNLESNVRNECKQGEGFFVCTYCNIPFWITLLTANHNGHSHTVTSLS